VARLAGENAESAPACEGGIAPQLTSEGVDVFKEREKHRDAGWIMIADMQHYGRAIVAGERSGELVLIGQAVEPAAAHHRHTEGIGNALELWCHATGFADHDQPYRLASAAIERELLRHDTDGCHELLGAVPTIGLKDDARMTPIEMMRARRARLRCSTSR